MKISVAWQGGSELARELEKLSTRLSRKLLLEALAEAAKPMQKSMAVKAPRGDPRAPNLAQEIVIAIVRGQDSQEAAVAVGPSRRAFYGSFIELGTAHMPAKPFARPAFDESAQTSLGILGQALWRELAGRGASRVVTGGDGVTGGPGGGGLV